jgi:hypothetical protein
MKKNITLLLFLFLMFQAKSQDMEWAFGFSGSNNSLSESLEVKVSKNGEVYKLGSFHDSMDLNILNIIIQLKNI